MTVYEGDLDGSGLQLAVVVSRFNRRVTQPLLKGALAAARECGVEDGGAIDVIHVPGAFELPLAARRLASTGRYDAIACIGAVVRGGTPHFDFIAGEASSGISRVAADFDIPVSFGLITADTMVQARDRAGGRAGNKGREAMLAAIEMATLLPRIAANDR